MVETRPCRGCGQSIRTMSDGRLKPHRLPLAMRRNPEAYERCI